MANPISSIHTNIYQPATSDVLVITDDLRGLHIAYWLARSGKKVVLLDNVNHAPAGLSESIAEVDFIGRTVFDHEDTFVVDGYMYTAGKQEPHLDAAPGAPLEVQAISPGLAMVKGGLKDSTSRVNHAQSLRYSQIVHRAITDHQGWILPHTNIESMLSWGVLTDAGSSIHTSCIIFATRSMARIQEAGRSRIAS